MEGITYYPGSIGEVIQGNYRGMDVLLSCPINLFTRVRIFESCSYNKKVKYLKSTRLMENLLIKWDLKEYIGKLSIDIQSNIPKGKGFASSTADLCGTYYSLIKIFNREFDEEELIRECIKIEPTDSIIFNRATIFDYKNGNFKECIGDYLEFYLVVFEGCKVVDTIEFNKNVSIPLSYIDDIVEVLKEGIKNKDIKKIASASTESIMRNDKRLKYDILSEIIRQKNITEGLGILGAHSGDLMAIIYDDLQKAKRALHRINLLSIRNYKTYIVKTISTENYKYTEKTK